MCFDFLAPPHNVQSLSIQPTRSKKWILASYDGCFAKGPSSYATRPFKGQTDTSNIGLGAVPTQESDRGEYVIAYASRLLHGHEKSYSVSEKECLVVVWVVEKWQKYLEGQFQILTVHGALVWVFKHPQPTSKLMRWAIRLQGLDLTVQYRSGQCNVVPDSLSRLKRNSRIQLKYVMHRK